MFQSEIQTIARVLLVNVAMTLKMSRTAPRSSLVPKSAPPTGETTSTKYSRRKIFVAYVICFFLVFVLAVVAIIFLIFAKSVVFHIRACINRFGVYSGENSVGHSFYMIDIDVKLLELASDTL